MRESVVPAALSVVGVIAIVLLLFWRQRGMMCFASKKGEQAGLSDAAILELMNRALDSGSVTVKEKMCITQKLQTLRQGSDSEMTLLSKVKTITGMWQVVTQFGVVLNVRLPITLRRFLEVLNVLNWDFLRVASASCLVPQDHFSGLVAMTAFPVGLSLLLLVFHCLAACCLRLRRVPRRRSSLGRPAPDRSFAGWIVDNSFTAWLALTFFVFVRIPLCALRRPCAP